MVTVNGHQIPWPYIGHMACINKDVFSGKAQYREQDPIKVLRIMMDKRRSLQNRDYDLIENPTS